MSAPPSNLPPRPAHLPAPPAFPPAANAAPPSSSAHRGDSYVPSYGRDRDEWSSNPREGDERERRDSLGRDLDERKRRRSPSSSDSPRKELRRENPSSNPITTSLTSRGASRQPTHPSSRGGPTNATPSAGVDPDLLEHMLHFSDWAASFRYRNPEVVAADDPVEQSKKMQDRYEVYRKKFLSRQLYGLFLVHKSSQWFIEKYSVQPEILKLRERIRKEAREGLTDVFMAELDAGKFDHVSFDYVDNAESEAPTDLPEEPPRDEQKNDFQTQLMNGQPAPNQIYIKSIAPSISRESIEKVCQGIAGFKTLALGAPSEKKAFHRGGWVTFAEGTDLQAACDVLEGCEVGEPAFVLHAAVHNTPTASRPKLAPEGTNALERLQKDLDQARRLAILLESQQEGQSHLGSEAIEQKIGRTFGEDELEGEAAVKKAKLHLDLYILYLRNAFHTCYYSASVNDSREELDRRSVVYFRKQKRTAQSPSKESIDSPAVPASEEDESKAVEANGAEEEVMGEPAEGGEDKEGESGERSKSSGVETDGGEKLSGLNMMIWSQDLDPKIHILLHRETMDPAEAGGKNVAEETTRIISTFIKQEDEGKFRCKICVKLFKGVDFVKKHIPLKHPENMKALDDVHFFNSFALDPLHLMPPNGAPAAVNDEILPPRPVHPTPMNGLFPPGGFPIPGVPFYGAPPVWMNPMSYNPGFVGLANNPYLQPGMFHPGSGYANPGGRGGRGGGRGVVGPGSAGARPGYGGPQHKVGGGEPVDTTLGRPEGVSEDPRAKKGRVSYNDLDASLPQGDLQLDY